MNGVKSLDDSLEVLAANVKEANFHWHVSIISKCTLMHAFDQCYKMTIEKDKQITNLRNLKQSVKLFYERDSRLKNNLQQIAHGWIMGCFVFNEYGYMIIQQLINEPC